MRCIASLLAAIGCFTQLSLPAPHPGEAKNFYELGKAELQTKHYQQAAASFTQAELQSPGATNALALRAKALIHLNRFDEARQSLDAYLRSHPNSPDGRYLLAFVLFRKGLARESLSMYTAAAALGRPTADDFKIVGLDYVLLNDQPNAIRWLERSVHEEPDDADATYHLGRAYYVQNNFDKAIAAFTRTLELDRTHVKAENNLGLALAGKNESALAEAAYRKAIQMSEASAVKTDQPYLNLAELLSHGDRKNEALSLLDKAEQISGKSERSEELRGQILLAQNRLSDAETAFRMALSLQPDKGALHYQLGRILKREGKSDTAEKEFGRSRALLETHSSAPN